MAKEKQTARGWAARRRRRREKLAGRDGEVKREVVSLL